MNKIFCVSCGFKILYEVAKPKFCSSCGNSLGSISSSARKEEEEEVSDLDIDLSKLKRDIVVENNKRKTKIEDIWGSVTSSEASGPQENFPALNREILTGKSFWIRLLEIVRPHA